MLLVILKVLHDALGAQMDLENDNGKSLAWISAKNGHVPVLEVIILYRSK